MNRRGFFATLAGAVAARFAPKPVVQTLSIEDIAGRLGYRAAMHMDLMMRSVENVGGPYATCCAVEDFLVQAEQVDGI